MVSTEGFGPSNTGSSPVRSTIISLMKQWRGAHKVIPGSFIMSVCSGVHSLTLRGGR